MARPERTFPHQSKQQRRFQTLLRQIVPACEDDADAGHLVRPAATIGEMENRQKDEASSRDAARSAKPKAAHPTLKYRFERHAIKIVFADTSAADERYGGSGDVAIIEGELLRPQTVSNTVIIFMHPSGIQNLLPMPMAMARSGLHVVTCCSRYPNNDSTLIMEKVVCDLGACVRHCRGKLGYKRILLAGWSGGGALVSFYQSQAELGDKALQTTPAGDAVDIKSFVEPVDGLLILAAHVSRARVLTDWMDPSVLDENDPSRRDLELDLYDSRNPNKPPFSADYMERFRTAQVARNRRITSWVREKLKYLEEEAASSSSAVADWRSGRRDIGFVVHCTQADPRRLDISLDPNGRSATSLAELSRENHSPVGLARFCTLRSWLSQWSKFCPAIITPYVKDLTC
eukprot:TRINITY_DN27001_c0_g1_i3.p1 TRINITY_DN27001_c0_g1~~TRINITY_DN27001_c0_g1_i3.p1  ORF type:complete len:402 (+),score=49.43 TRINITY_DN27001_c0_g1_i3:72-1277(+)